MAYIETFLRLEDVDDRPTSSGVDSMSQIRGGITKKKNIKSEKLKAKLGAVAIAG